MSKSGEEPFVTLTAAEKRTDWFLFVCHANHTSWNEAAECLETPMSGGGEALTPEQF